MRISAACESDHPRVTQDEEVSSTYSAGRDLGDINAERLTQTHGNSSPAHRSRGSSGTKTGNEGREAQEESRSLLHDELTGRFEELERLAWERPRQTNALYDTLDLNTT